MDFVIDLVKSVFRWVYSLYSDRRYLRLRVHKAYFSGSKRPYFFINATNMSPNRELEVTHIWFNCDSQIPVIRPDRPLPKRFKPNRK